MAGPAPIRFITPDWPAPSNVRALSTTRVGGVSVGAYSSLNLAMHVDDSPAAVARNRELLLQTAAVPSEPIWLQQVHGVQVWTGGPTIDPPIADASVAKSTEEVCAILTADCLPVIFCDLDGTTVGAAHAGWRGLLGGVLRQTISRMSIAPSRILAWLGPAIEQSAFEVGDEVREQFIAADPRHSDSFQQNSRGRWQADLYQLARRELQMLGVERVYGGDFGTVADSERFFSYRRDKQTGRMATLIWLSS